MAGAIWWVRRDCRLADNQALDAAIKHHPSVIPTFVIDPTILNSPNFCQNRYAFLLANLHELDSALRECGSRLVVRTGEPAEQLKQLVSETTATGVFAEADFTPYARKRDSQVQKAVPLTLTQGLVGRNPSSVLKKDGTPYTVFTPYKKRWLAKDPIPAPLPAPDKITTPSDLASDDLPDIPLPSTIPFLAGEAEAHKRLIYFLDNRIHAYDDARNRMDYAGTSTLSPYFRFGIISARQAMDTLRRDTASVPTKGHDVWLSELIWRDFYQMILCHFPHVKVGSFRPVYDKIEWRNDKTEFEAWCQGQTGYPIVDAAMRQLLHTGWMHNRARMIVASFLTKDLLINWQWGERWFMQNLIDGDIAANNGGWQWSAGTGTDAAPYFRIFNPESQSRKFDPDGNYIRKWVPELAALPDKLIHTPQNLKPLDEARYKFKLGTTYPAPIVDHKIARQGTLDAYKQARSN